jgi:hypothetical protein
MRQKHLVVPCHVLSQGVNALLDAMNRSLIGSVHGSDAT